jgi:hypothetical protein
MTIDQPLNGSAPKNSLLVAFFDILRAVVCVVLFIVGLPIIALYRAWVLSQLWGWFVVPVFHLPALEIRYALGLSLIVSMFAMQFTSLSSLSLDTKSDEKLGKDVWKSAGWIFKELASLTLTLVLGWMVISFWVAP